MNSTSELAITVFIGYVSSAILAYWMGKIDTFMFAKFDMRTIQKLALHFSMCLGRFELKNSTEFKKTFKCANRNSIYKREAYLEIGRLERTN